MSFCLPQKNEQVERNVKEATSNGVIFVAAASNYGNNESRGFPAKMWQALVIRVHAVDGNGNKILVNPAPETRRDNFASLGVAIRSAWHAEEVFLEGTSYATAVMTGIISNILRFVHYAWQAGFLGKDHFEEAFCSRGMSNILSAMAVQSDSYDYIRPKWKTWQETEKVQDVPSSIKSAVGKDM
jgi:hypothetical protein